MNIAQVAFSIDWFLTIPGILISCGVILLIIALIMFVVSTSGNSKEEVPSVLENKEESKEFNVEPVVTEVEEKVEEVVPLIDTVSEEVVVPSFEGDENAEQLESPVDDTVTLEEFIPDVDEIPVIEVPVDEPTVEPVEEVEIPAVEETAVEEIPTIETVSEEVPVVEDETTEVEHRPIYGGADPLEATQKLPKVDVHYEPYSGGNEVQEVTVVDEEENSEPTFILNEEVEPIADESQNIEISIEEPVVESTDEVEIPVIDDETLEEVPQVIAIPDEEIEEL